MAVTCAAVAFAVLGVGVLHQWLRQPAPIPTDADWTLSATSRSVSLVGWPASVPSAGVATWSIPPGTYRKLFVNLPGRPVIECVDPSDIFVECRDGQVETITIGGNPVTVQQAVNKLEADATVWGWRPITPELNRWVARNAEGDRSTIGNGDFQAGFVPIVDSTLR